jgi:hypothetical protein
MWEHMQNSSFVLIFFRSEALVKTLFRLLSLISERLCKPRSSLLYLSFSCELANRLLPSIFRSGANVQAPSIFRAKGYVSRSSSLFSFTSSKPPMELRTQHENHITLKRNRFVALSRPPLNGLRFFQSSFASHKPTGASPLDSSFHVLG